MASKTYTEDVIVLGKTKLGEADLILTCLASDGQQLRFVAKGARKPGGSFASRLELYSCARVLLVQGRSLDIVKEARLINGHAKLRTSMDKSSAAAPMAELLARVSQDGLEAPRLYEMTLAAFEALEMCEDGLEPCVLAAYLVKAFAFCGFAPSLLSCASCGAPVQGDRPYLRFSYEEGGVICETCRPHVSSVELPTAQIANLHALLRARFSELSQLGLADDYVFDALRLCQTWSRTHIGARNKSLDFLLSFALALPQQG